MDETLEAWDLVINQDGSKPSFLYQYGGISNLCDSGIGWAGRCASLWSHKPSKGSTRRGCYKLLTSLFSAIYRAIR